MPRITEAELQADGLLLRWDNERQSRFPWFWLRDHGQDPASLDPTTLQRRVDPFALDDEVQGSAASVLDEGRGLVVAWPAGVAEHGRAPGRERVCLEWLNSVGAVQVQHTQQTIRPTNKKP